MARIGNTSPHFLVAKALAEALGEPVGDAMALEVDITPVKLAHSDDQRSGFHWLLGEWLKLDRELTVDLPKLKEQVQMAHFGVVRRVGLHGQEDLIPARTTTRVWDFNKNRYRKEQLPLEDYSLLIQFVYDMAALDNIQLPEMEKDCDRSA